MDVPNWIEPALRDELESATAALKTGLAHRLVSVVLIGAAAHDRPRPIHRTELLVVATAIELTQMRNLATALRRHLEAGLHFRTVTVRELERACDVFALEIAEWGTHHRVLWGKSPFTDLSIEPAHLREGIERELRGLSTELRNRVLNGLAVESRREKAALAVPAGLERLLMIAHHCLALIGQEPPDDEAALLRALVDWIGGDPEPVLGLWEELQRGEELRPAWEGLAVLLPVVGLASVAVDHLVP